MSELDELLIRLAKDRSKSNLDKDRVKFVDATGFKKVAFDVYKDEYNNLWSVESTDDGDFLVRGSHPRAESKESGLWSAASNYASDSVTLSYKGVPICSFSSDDYGFSKDDIFIFKSALLDITKDDPSFVGKLVDSQVGAKASAIKNIFPDLFKTN